MKRVKVSHKKANPLFEQWLKEWRDSAKERGNDNLALSINRALTTLKKYPVPLQTGKECGILKHFGKALCSMLDRKLEEYQISSQKGTSDFVLPRSNATSKARTQNNPSSAQSSAAGSGTNDKQTGKKPATKRKKAENVETIEDEVAPSTDNDILGPQIIFPPSSSKVVLLVDTGETSSGSKKASKVATMKELESQRIPFEIRDLSAGDFLWVARYNDQELVLPYIIERKRSDDFAKSIKDNRYKEQKMRLQSTGLNVIYLIEVTQTKHLSLPFETLCQAEVNTELNDNFCLHRTSGIKDTVTYLATMTNVLQNKIKNKTLSSITAEHGRAYSIFSDTLYLHTFKEFNDGAAKLENFTVCEMFAQHLLQISGVSTEAACALVDKFLTPAKLREEFAKCSTESQCLELITNVKFADLKRNVPPEVARKIWLFYTVSDFSTL